MEKRNIIRGNPDTALFIAIILLLGIGLVMVYSSGMSSDTSSIFTKQIISLVVAVVCLILFSFINHNILFKYNKYILLSSLILLIMTLIPPFGVTLNKANRWINFGFIQFQPSEISKLGLIIYLSITIAIKKDKIKNLTNGFLPLMIVTIVTFLLVLIEPDFSMSFLILITALSLFYVGGIKIKYILLSFLMSIPILLSLTLIASHRLDRIRAFIDPSSYSDSIGYQSIKFMKALANGGLFGMGLGNGIQKQYIPYSFNDSIFSVIAEEIGFLGSLMVILLYLLFAYRGYTVSFNAPTKSSRLLAFGITTLISLQTMINLGVVIGGLPITGMTLPFISFGGTSLTMTCIGSGILLNISKYKIADDSIGDSISNSNGGSTGNFL